MNQDFDIGIIGGGCAGLQLLYRLTQQKEWPDLKILLIDDQAEKSQQSWCFWSKADIPLQHLISNTWTNLRFRSPNGIVKQERIIPYRYHYISGATFFNYFWQELIPANTNITVIKDQVTRITNFKGGFVVETNQGNFIVKKCFSSIIAINFQPESALWQHFKGWHIETDTDVFDDTAATLMDFSVPGTPPESFVYVLPFSPRRALIEATFFSTNIVSDQVYEQLIRQFIGNTYPGIAYRILLVEKGRIPMSQQFISRYGPAGEILIGTAGGMVKATSGYVFNRIDRDSKILVQQLFSRKGQMRLAIKRRFRFYDTLLLRIIKEKPAYIPTVFTNLFLKNNIKDILQFLDEETSLVQEIAIFATLPLIPFIKQAIKYYLKKNIEI